ncbi:hypothetical protein B5F40_02230 [Gordonibacter sp. An230]|nr:hypothetical protein B5F40_02230 [Gordonibacter sp. An230]
MPDRVRLGRYLRVAEPRALATMRGDAQELTGARLQRTRAAACQNSREASLAGLVRFRCADRRIESLGLS